MNEKTKYQLKSSINPLKYSGLVITFFVLLSSNSFGQSITWEKTYLQSAATTGSSIKQTTDGNYIVTGWRLNFGGFICKLNPLGDTLWTRYTPYRDMQSIVEAPDGSYVAIGYDYYLYITKYSPFGVQIWAKVIEEPNHEIYSSNIINTTDNNFFVTGYTRLGIPSIRSAYYLKIDQNGNRLWSKIITEPNTILGLRMPYQTVDSGFVVIGTQNYNNNGQLYIIKADKYGDTQWTKSYGSPIFETGHSIFQTSDKGFLAFGNIVYSNQNIKLYFLKTDSIGNFQWSKIYGDTNSFYQLLFGENATKSKYDLFFYLTGFSTNYPYLDTNKVFVLKIDENGNKIWEKSYKKDTLHLRGFAIDQTSDSGFVISGDAFDSPVFTNNLSDPQFLYVLKLDKNGIINPIGINNNQQQVPVSFKILKIYPNPFNPVTNILFEIDKTQLLTIRVFDILGKEVEKLAQRYFGIGVHRIIFEATNRPNGIYFIEIKSFYGQKVVKPVVLIK